MSGVWPWIAAVTGVAGWLAGRQLHGWTKRRTAAHHAAVQQVLDDDRVIQQLEQQLRQPARERQEQTGD